MSRTSTRAAKTAANVVAQNPELEAAIVAAPDDPANYLVYADWLQEQGDPLGTLIALDVQAEAGDVRAERRFSRWLNEHDMLGRSTSDLKRTLSLEWRYGFVESLYAGKPNARLEFDVVDILERVLELRVCRFVREVAVCPFHRRDDASATIDALVRAKPPVLEDLGLFTFRRVAGLARLSALPRLRNLEVDVASPGVVTLDGVPPALEELTIVADRVRIPDPNLELPSLRRLTIEGARPRSVAQWLGAGSFPALEHIELSGCYGDEPEGAAYDELGPGSNLTWLSRTDAPKLCSLALKDVSNTGSLVPHLGDSPWCAHLERLSLEDGDLEGAELPELAALLDGPLRGVVEVDLRGNWLTAEDVAALRRPGRTVVYDD